MNAASFVDGNSKDFESVNDGALFTDGSPSSRGKGVVIMNGFGVVVVPEVDELMVNSCIGFAMAGGVWIGEINEMTFFGKPSSSCWTVNAATRGAW